MAGIPKPLRKELKKGIKQVKEKKNRKMVYKLMKKTKKDAKVKGYNKYKCKCFDCGNRFESKSYMGLRTKCPKCGSYNIGQ